MHLPECARSNLEVSCSHCLGDWEIFRICDADQAAGRSEGILSVHVVGELDLALVESTGFLVIDAAWYGALENVLLGGRDVEEFLGLQSEVLG